MRRRALMRIGRIPVVLVALAACQSLLDFGSAGDGGAGDGSAPDVPGPTDAGGLGDVLDSCEATFCDDFDEEPLGAKWDHRKFIDASLSLAPSDRSPPYRLLAGFPAGAGYVEATLAKGFGAATSVKCSFWIRPTPSSSAVDVFWLSPVSPTVETYDLYFGLQELTSGPKASLREDVRYLDGAAAFPAEGEEFFDVPAPETWTRVTIETDFKTATVKYGDLLMANHAIPVDLAPTDVRLSFGVRSWERVESLEASFDDLSCTVTRTTGDR